MHLSFQELNPKFYRVHLFGSGLALTQILSYFDVCIFIFVGSFRLFDENVTRFQISHTSPNIDATPGVIRCAHAYRCRDLPTTLNDLLLLKPDSFIQYDKH